MRLTFDQIKSITVGAVAVEQRDDGIHFMKCTEGQTAAWYKMSDILGDRSLSTTGIRLDFITNSKSFSFGSSSGAKYELLIDSQQRFVIVPTEAGTQKIDYSVNLTNARFEQKDEYRVTLVFPSHGSPGVITHVELDDCSYVKPCEYSTKMLFIGDSITQGHNSGYDSLSYAYRVSAHFNANSVINGIGGAYFEETTFEKIGFDPDIVIVAYGTNDWGRCGNDPEKILAHACGYMDLIKDAYFDKRVFVISPIWRCVDATGESMPALFDECRRRIESEARARGFFAVDGLSLVPPVREFFADGHLHPNAIGFSFYAENLIKAIKENL